MANCDNVAKNATLLGKKCCKELLGGVVVTTN